MTIATRVMPSSPITASLFPQIEFPEDPGLHDLPKLFDADWIWQLYRQQFGGPEANPQQIRIRQFSHSRGRVAIVSYEVEWQADEYIPSELFVARIERDKPMVLFRYTDDAHLPGLREAAYPETALKLVNRHVLAIPARRARVELVRYRPANRAVLRYSVGRVKLYARVMRPSVVEPLLTAHHLLSQSRFVVPRLAGCWAEGGVVWMSEIPGKNLRRYIRQGKMPDPSPLLDGLESLWNAPDVTHGSNPFNLSGTYQSARRSFMHNVRDNGAAQRSLYEATRSLDPFIQSWRPSSIAHNDFYDDQLLVLRDGRIALVDFEEAGPGDPMLDAGNFLAHLRWSSRFGRKGEAPASGAYYHLFRHAALERFRWSDRDLALREAVCLFRICTNAVRHPKQDWHDTLEAGLSLVSETLG